MRARSASARASSHGGWGSALGDEELGTLCRQTRSAFSDARALSREKERSWRAAAQADLCARARA